MVAPLPPLSAGSRARILSAGALLAVAASLVTAPAAEAATIELTQANVHAFAWAATYDGTFHFDSQRQQQQTGDIPFAAPSAGIAAPLSPATTAAALGTGIASTSLDTIALSVSGNGTATFEGAPDIGSTMRYESTSHFWLVLDQGGLFDIVADASVFDAQLVSRSSVGTVDFRDGDTLIPFIHLDAAPTAADQTPELHLEQRVFLPAGTYRLQLFATGTAVADAGEPVARASSAASFSLVPVPEPMLSALLALGGASWLVRSTRRRRGE